jgi:hypothetical protein
MVFTRGAANGAHRGFGWHTGGWAGGFQITILVPWALTLDTARNYLAVVTLAATILWLE